MYKEIETGQKELKSKQITTKRDSSLKNILITGANGQLGTSLALLCNPADANFFFTDVKELDITKKREVERYIAENQIDLVINCAAYTNVERAEDDRKNAEKLNALAPKYLAESCLRNNVFLIHISTDFVFGGGKRTYDGTKGYFPITERVKPSPLNVYGATKLRGEREIQESGCKYLIIRTSWLYSEFGHNFVKTMLSLFSTKKEVRVVNDQTGTPTYAGDLAELIYKISMKIVAERFSTSKRGSKGNQFADSQRIKKIIAKGGIYHYSNQGECSWYDFALEIFRLFQKYSESLGSSEKCHVKSCTSAEYPTKAQRPIYSVLSKAKIERDFQIAIPTWQTSLRKCLKNM